MHRDALQIEHTPWLDLTKVLALFSHRRVLALLNIV